MVRTYIRKGSGPPDPELVRRAVIQFIHGKLSFRATAEEFSLKKSTLADAVKRYKAKMQILEQSGASGSNFDNDIVQESTKFVFTSKQEKELAAYLEKCSLLNHGLTPYATRKLAYQWAITLKIKFPSSWKLNERAGVDWLRGFIKRNASLSIRKPENTSQACAAGFNAVVIGVFFRNLQELYCKYHFPPGRIWNCDETGVPTVVQAPKVIAKRGAKQVAQTVSAERGENTTMLCFVSAIGQTIPPVFVFPRVKAPERMYRDGPPGCIGLAHRSGWMTLDNFLCSMEHFLKEVKPSKKDPVLLLFDNHESHISVELVSLCKDNGIHLLTFPPHCSHRLQPLDVSVYAPLKHAIRESFDNWMQLNPGQRISIHEIAKLCKYPFLEKLNPQNITAGFEKAGIWPLNPNVFTEVDFLPAEVTNRPDPAEQNAPETSNMDDPHPGLFCDSSPVMMGQQQSNLPTAVTPESIRPYPQAKMQVWPSKNRKKGKSRILTETPEKRALEAETELRLAKKKKKSLKKSKVSLIADKTRDSISDIDIQLNDESDDESLHCGSISEFETDEELSCGNFVLVRFMVGKKQNSAVYYVGEIEEISGRVAKINYLRKSGRKFIFPECRDCAETDFQDIIMKLPAPVSVGGTGRTAKALVFGCDLAQFPIQ